jgi:hypothetical protein
MLPRCSSILGRRADCSMHRIMEIRAIVCLSKEVTRD